MERAPFWSWNRLLFWIRGIEGGGYEQCSSLNHHTYPQDSTQISLPHRLLQSACPVQGGRAWWEDWEKGIFLLLCVFHSSVLTITVMSGSTDENTERKKFVFFPEGIQQIFLKPEQKTMWRVCEHYPQNRNKWAEKTWEIDIPPQKEDRNLAICPASMCSQACLRARSLPHPHSCWTTSAPGHLLEQEACSLPPSGLCTGGPYSSEFSSPRYPNGLLPHLFKLFVKMRLLMTSTSQSSLPYVSAIYQKDSTTLNGRSYSALRFITAKDEK